jgi:hypothetical protein
MLEDLTFDPSGDRGTRFGWRVHYRPAAVMRLVHPIARSFFGRMLHDSMAGLARYVKAHPSRPS